MFALAPAYIETYAVAHILPLSNLCLAHLWANIFQLGQQFLASCKQMEQ